MFEDLEGLSDLTKYGIYEIAVYRMEYDSPEEAELEGELYIISGPLQGRHNVGITVEGIAIACSCFGDTLKIAYREIDSV